MDCKLRERFRKFRSYPDQPDQVFHQRNIRGHTGCVNSVEFSHSQDMMASGGDDQRILVWSVGDLLARGDPEPRQIMREKHSANIFTYSFSNDDRQLYSGGNDSGVLLHDIATGSALRQWHGASPVYHLSCSPVDDHVVAAARDQGHIDFYDTRSNENSASTVLRFPGRSAYCGAFNPEVPNIFAVCTEGDGLSMHDLRHPKKKLFDFSRHTPRGCFYGEFDSTGKRIVLNQNKDYPLVLDLPSAQVLRLKDPQFRSFHTIKSVIFAEDDVVMMGGDDFNIYAWQIPDGFAELPPVEGLEMYRNLDNCTTMLQGHRSIVNHVRYNKKMKALASCGIEKIVKIWTPYATMDSTINPILRTPQMGGFIDPVENLDDNVDEDPQMLSYFDEISNQTRHETMGGSMHRGFLDDSDDSGPFSAYVDQVHYLDIDDGISVDSDDSNDSSASESTGHHPRRTIQFFFQAARRRYEALTAEEMAADRSDDGAQGDDEATDGRSDADDMDTSGAVADAEDSEREGGDAPSREPITRWPPSPSPSPPAV